MGIPLMYESYDEVYWVHEKMRPKLEASLEAKGFVVLNWADGGWVHFFTTKPVAVPDDLRTLKLFSWAGDAEAVEVWRSAGFNPVPLPSTELATALQTGLVEALGSPPQVAVISQFFTHARNMTEPAGGCCRERAVAGESWDKVPADVQPQLGRSREAGALQKEIREAERRDVEAMQKRSLTVVPERLSTRSGKLTEASISQGALVPAAFDEAWLPRRVPQDPPA